MKPMTSDDVITEAMIRYGGSFAKQLGELFRVADNENRDKLIRAFADYWSEYSESAKMHPPKTM